MADKIVHLTDSARIITGTSLFIEEASGNSKLVSTFVGLTKTKKIVVTPPKDINQNTRKELNAGDGVIVKYVFEDKLFIFETKYINQTTKPVGFFVFEHPEHVRIRERRSEKRYKCFISTQTELFGKKRDGTIRDISKNGCRCNFYIPNNDEIETTRIGTVFLNCQFPGIRGEVILEGEVKNFFIDSPMVTFGILFINLSPEQKKIIDKYIMSIEDFV
jgi:hypothetical protein